MDVLRRAERAIVRALRDEGWGQSQVTHRDRFEIATDDLVVKVWTLDAYERERGAVKENERLANVIRESYASLMHQRPAEALEYLRSALNHPGGR